MSSRTTITPPSESTGPGEINRHRSSMPSWVPAVWVAFVVASLLALDVVDQPTWSWTVPVAAAALLVVAMVAVPARPWLTNCADRADLAVVGVSYLAVVGLFRLAFVGFTQDNALGLFLSFAAGLLLGVVGPIIYTVWLRERPLRTLGLGLHRWRPTVALGLALAAVQFGVTL